MSGAAPAYTPAQVLPHVAPMLLIDAIDAWGDDWAQASLTVRDTDLFHEPGVGVPAWVGIEYMAQTLGAFDGIDRLRHGQPPQIGFLIGTRRYEAEVPAFAAGDRLQVTARVVLRDEDNLVVFDCAIVRDGVTVARAAIKAYRPANLHAFLADSS